MTGIVLFLLFTVIPALETWLIVKVGSVIGATDTVLYLVGMGVLGAWLGKRAGFAVLRDVMADVQAGRAPTDKLVEAALVLVGSVLLVTPGVLTDVTGTLLFIAPLRRWLAPRVRVAVGGWLTRRGVVVGSPLPGAGAATPWPTSPPPPAGAASQRPGAGGHAAPHAPPKKPGFQHPVA